jgi:hypothetical protein
MKGPVDSDGLAKTDRSGVAFDGRAARRAVGLEARTVRATGCLA